MLTIHPFLWFHSQAEEAATFYTSVFPHSRILRTIHNVAGGPGPAGSVLTVEFELAGQRIVAINGGSAYTLSEAISMVVNCDTQAEIDHYWDVLAAGGEHSRCGWLKDRFGLSWQVVPANFPSLLGHPDPVRAARYMQAMMTMDKLDLAALEAATLS